MQADIDRLVTTSLAEWGRVDILVNNAAYIGDAVFESFWKMSPQSWREMMELNVNVPWALSRAFAPALRERKDSLIVNLSSGPGNLPEPGTALPLPGAGGLGAAYPRRTER